MRLFTLIALIAISRFLSASDNCEQITISAHPNYPPFHWEQDGTLVGASIDVSVRILKEMGINPIVAYEGPWKRVLKKAELGQIDLIPALKNTAERRAYLSFTKSPFYSNPVAIFVKDDFSKTIQDLNDLEGLRGSISLGDKHGKLIDRFVNMQHKNIQSIYSMSSNFKMLALGRTDYFIQGLYTGRKHLNSFDQQDKIKVAQVFDANWVHHGFSKQSKCLHLLEEFDQRLSNLLDSGYIERSMNEHEHLWLTNKH